MLFFSQKKCHFLGQFLHKHIRKNTILSLIVFVYVLHHQNNTIGSKHSFHQMDL